MKSPRKYFLETKLLSYSTLIIIILVILSVWLSGKDSHHTLFQNSILSTSIIAGSFFLFISGGLYYGIKLKDNVGNILSKERMDKYPDFPSSFDGMVDGLPDVGEGILGIVVSIIVWILFSILIIVVVYFLGFFFWGAILLLGASLYWFFFRALRLVFKNSRQCRGNLLKSIAFGVFYSSLYVSWLYGIIFLFKYLNG